MPGGLDAGTSTLRHTCWWNLERCVTWPWEALGLCTGKYSACVSVHKELFLTIFARCLPLWLSCFDGHSSAALCWPWVLGREMDVSERLNLFCFVLFCSWQAVHATLLPSPLSCAHPPWWCSLRWTSSHSCLFQWTAALLWDSFQILTQWVNAFLFSLCLCTAIPLSVTTFPGRPWLESVSKVCVAEVLPLGCAVEKCLTHGTQPKR